MRKLPAWGFAGVLLFAAGLWALVADLEGWNAVWYLPAWYGYLLFLDAMIFRLQGRSYLAGRRGELLAMLLTSAPFWFLFEAYNLRLQNWYYVFGLRTQWLSAIVSVLAFSTVLPACLFHAELVKAMGWARGARCRSMRVTGAAELFCFAMGVLSIAAPLLWPRYAFWMVWGALLWLPELVNRRAGAPSLLADLEAGRAERLLQLIIGGLWAGAIWETFNFWARCKWIYTVPGFEDWKLFEMPFAGFLGFPVLALSAFASFSSVTHFLGSRPRNVLLRAGDSLAASGMLEQGLSGGPCGPPTPWPLVRRSSATPPRGFSVLPLSLRPRRARDGHYSDKLLGGRGRALRRSAAIAAAAILCGVTFRAMFERTVQSRRPLLSELAGVDPPTVALLRAAGIPTPERLSRAVRSSGLAAVANRTGVHPERLRRASRHAALSLHKGMGTRAAALLENAGIASVADLAKAQPEALFRKLSGAVRLSQVKVWIRSARLSGQPRR